MKKKIKIWTYLLLIIGLFFITTNSCEKDNSNNSNTITDKDGNVYHTITIGTQTWMLENLKTTKYNDGTVIPLVTDSAEWTNLKTPGYCWFNNDTLKNKNTYGALYNWYSVNTNKLCPTGWHVPTDAEWITLITYLKGDSIAGSKLKESGTTHWNSPNNADNSSGFSALPGGFRSVNGLFTDIGNCGYFWTASADDSEFAWAQSPCSSVKNINRLNNQKVDGLSVRCIKD